MVEKHTAHRLGLPLPLPSSARGRLSERDRTICCNTQVVSPTAFKKSSFPSTFSVVPCLMPRAHQPRARITTKKPFAVPFSVIDQLGFGGTWRDNAIDCWIRQEGCRFCHHFHHEFAKVASLSSSEMSGIALYFQPHFCQFPISSGLSSLPSLCSFFCREYMSFTATGNNTRDDLPCPVDIQADTPSPARQLHIFSTPFYQTYGPTLEQLLRPTAPS